MGELGLIYLILGILFTIYAFCVFFDYLIECINTDDDFHGGAERDSLNTLVDTQNKCYDIAIKKLESVEAERNKLQEECASWERWNRRCIETKNEWGKKLTEAEAEVKRLNKQLREQENA